MSLIKSTSAKKFYTRAQDETIIAMKAEGASNKQVAAAVGHSEASVSYRIQRVLSQPDLTSLDQINYRGAGAVAVTEAPEETTEA